MTSITNKRVLFIAFVVITILSAVTGSPYVVTYNDAEDNTISPERLPESPLLGRKACTRGPAYWCYNITQAKQCGAVSHCIQRVWEPMKLPADNDSVCEVCKEMVKEARDQLLSNETQDELRQVLEGSCNLIPLKIVAAECRKLSDDFIPELIDVLTSRMDPEVVCAVSGLCNSVRIDEMLGEMKAMEPSKTPAPFDLETNSCPKCTHYMGKAVTFLQRLPKEQLLTKMLAICGHLGSYSDSCRGVVMEELDIIYNHVQNELNAPEVCGLVGLCEVVSIHPVKIQTPSTSVRAWTPPVNDDDLECDFCKQLVTYLKTWFTSDTTKEEFHDLVIGMCKQTGKYRQECLNLAKEYGKEIYDLIVEGLVPEEVCGSAGICNNSTVQGRVKIFSSSINVGPIWTLLPAGSNDEIPLTKLRPAERITGEDEKKSHQPGVYPMMELSPSERLTGDDEANAHNIGFDPAVCETCQNIAVEAQKFFKSHLNVTEEKLSKYVLFWCDHFLNKEQITQCHDIVAKYGHAFVHVMIKDMDPDIVCPAVKLCPIPPDMNVDLTVGLETLPVQAPVRDILPTCALCTFTVTKLVDLIGGNKSKAAIDAAMDRVCYVVPAKYEEKCLSFMKEYGEKVAEMILLEGGAHEICAAIHLCLFSPSRANPTTTEHPIKLVGDALLSFDRYMPKAMVKDVMDKIKEVYPTIQSHIQVVVDRFNPADRSDDTVDEKPTCAMCEFVMTQLDSMLENNATEQEIKDTVEHICDYLPKTVRTECRQFVDEYGDLVISYLAQSLEPREICVKLNLCDATSIIIDDDGLVTNVELTDVDISNVDLNRCELCKLISDYLSAFLEDPEVDVSIEEMVEKVCPLLPSNHRNDCKDIVEDYGPYLLSLLAQATDKGKACEIINLCPAA